ncbi:interleukin-6 receptor subunit beta isoform X2 [Labrus bergylta]|uniref:interleukin-6 receptor subunit beta isoform X2 n=1 Tax=Labrus bergylta TaxID=56723 RepID=UPI003313936B
MERLCLPALCTLMSLLCVFSLEVTVKDTDLELCRKHNRACVTDLHDCDPRPPSSIQKNLNMSCYYYQTHKTVTCEWSEESESHTQSDVSLIFSSRNLEILSCSSLINPLAVFDVTARIKNYMMESEIWSRPHTLNLRKAVRPLQPVLTALSSTQDSIVVSWNCIKNCTCQLYYRVNKTHTWTQAPDLVSAHPNLTLTHTVRDLQPFTVYRAAVRCRERSNIWSKWSADITASTLEKALSSVRHLWASSSSMGLLVQWEPPTDPPPSFLSLSHYALQWRSETRPSTTHWTTVDNFSTSTVIQDVDPEDSYLITVFPVYQQQCGPPHSLPASLQQGALSEAVKLRIVDVTKTTVTVVWEWQQKSGPIRVDAYEAMLSGESEGKTLSLWPDKQQHTFLNLKPNTDYSLLLLADGASRSIIAVTTDFDEVPLVATATPLMLLTVTVFIISILSRTVYKSYFFPPISSPRCSTTGQWLMEPNNQKPAERHILDIDDFMVMDLLGPKSFITVSSTCEPSPAEGLHEEAPLLSISQLFIQMDPEYVSDAPVFTEPLLASLQTSYHPVYTVSCNYTDQDQDQDQDQEVFISEAFLQKEEESRWDFETSPHRETLVKSSFHEFMANMNSVCVYQTSCRAELVGNSSSSQGNRDVETNCSSLICENDYIANSCSPAQTTDED